MSLARTVARLHALSSRRCLPAYTWRYVAIQPVAVRVRARRDTQRRLSTPRVKGRPFAAFVQMPPAAARVRHMYACAARRKAFMYAFYATTS